MDDIRIPCMKSQLVRQRTLELGWNAGAHLTREESQGVEATAAGLGVRAARLLIAVLGPKQDGAGSVQVTFPVLGVKR